MRLPLAAGEATAPSSKLTSRDYSLLPQASVQQVNPNAQVMRKGNALAVNVSAGQGLKAVLASNLGEFGTAAGGRGGDVMYCRCPLVGRR